MLPLVPLVFTGSVFAFIATAVDRKNAGKPLIPGTGVFDKSTRHPIPPAPPGASAAPTIQLRPMDIPDAPLAPAPSVVPVAPVQPVASVSVPTAAMDDVDAALDDLFAN